MDLLTLSVPSIIFIATLVRSTFGFGESLVAVPLLLLLIPLELAVPLSVLVSITVAAIVVIQDRKEIHFRSAKWLVVFAVAGIPVGLLLLIYGNEAYVKVGLGFIIILYSVYSLRGRQYLNLKSDHMGWLFLCGFSSGVFGGAYGLNGPPLVLYGQMRKWTAGYFRATLQAYFLPVSIIGMSGYWYKGLWTASVNHYFFISLPAIIPAIFLGRYLNRRLKNGAFLNYIYIGLIAIGLLLLIQSATALNI